MQQSENRAQNEEAGKQTVSGQPGARSFPLTPVATPLYVWWREFRASVLPVIIFSLGVVVVVLCWKQIGAATGVAGVGEGVRTSVSTPFAARVQRMLVDPYQVVKSGDPVAVIVPNDPRVDLDLLQTELAIARLQLQPTIAEGNAMNFEQIRIDLLRTKAELGIARVNLERAENQVRRNTPLFREKLVSEDIQDLALKTRDMYAVEVLEKSNAVAHIQMRVEALEALGLPRDAATNSPESLALSRVRELQSSAGSNWGPITLRAPINGMVTSIMRQEGENVIAGEPLVTIGSVEAHRVIGYLRQPYNLLPDVGADVVMTTRERHPRKMNGQVTEIGAQVEIITNSLAYIKPGFLVDAGLPFVVRLPHGSQLRPGEIVDLSFRKSATAGASTNLDRASAK